MPDAKRVIEVLVKARTELAALGKAKGELADFSRYAMRAGTTMATAGTAIIGALTGVTVAAAKSAEQIYDLSQRTGATAESLSTLRTVAEQNGASIESVAASMKFLAKNATEASNGNKELAAAFKRVGVDVHNADGSLKTSEQLLYAVSDGMKTVTDESERTSLSLNLMGRGAFDMAEFMKLGSAGMKEGQEQARKLGHEISTGAAKAADDFGDSVQNLKRTIGGAAQAISQQLIPAIVPLVEKATQAVVKFGEWVRENPNLAKGIAGVALAMIGTGGLLAALSVVTTALTTGAAAAGTFWTAVSGPAGLAVVAITAATLGIAALVDEMKKAKKEADDFQKMTGTHGAVPASSPLRGPLRGREYARPTPSAVESFRPGDIISDLQLGGEAEKKITGGRPRGEYHLPVRANWYGPNGEELTEEYWQNLYGGGVTKPYTPVADWVGRAARMTGHGPSSRSTIGEKWSTGAPLEALSLGAQEVILTMQGLTSAAGTFGKALVMGENSIKAFGNAALQVAADLVGRLMERAAGGFFGLIVKAVGLSSGGLVVPRGVQRFANGGVAAGGLAGRDSVLGLLTPGEVILKPSQLKRLLSGGGGSRSINVTIQAGAFAGDRAQALAFADWVAEAANERLTGSRW